MPSNFFLAKNSDQLLAELSDLHTFKQRVKFAEENWEKLGEGSSRTIFKLSPSLVLKVAHIDKGIAQNSLEGDPRLQKYPCLNHVLVADSEFKWIIVRFTSELTEDEFEDLTGLNFKQFGKAVYYKANNEYHQDLPRKYTEITEHPLFKCIFSAIMELDLQVGDCIKISSWGLFEDKPLLRDYGLSKMIYKKYYETGENLTENKSS